MKKRMNETDDILAALGSNSFKRFTKTKGNLHEFYLSGEIVEADCYVEWFDIIRNTTPNDTVKFYINSPGGDVYTAIQFLRVISDCEADVIASVEGCCMSAATMIFLAADDFEVTPHSAFMFHDYSSGTFGKGGEQYDQIQYERNWSENFLRAVYKDFLTVDEIKSMLHNKDIWLSSEEVSERLTARVKKQELEYNVNSVSEGKVV